MPQIYYRKNRLPVIFTHIPYVRENIGIIQGRSEHPEDVENRKILQRITSGEGCVSELESPDDFCVAISYPEEAVVNPDKNHLFKLYWLKFHDVCYWLNNQPPAGGAISYAEAGLEVEKIRSLAIKRSCVELFHKLETTRGMEKHAYLSKKDQKSILEKERHLFGNIDLQKIKNSYGLSGTDKSKPKFSISANISQQKRILELDNHQCVFEGVVKSCSGGENLEAGHIIPKAMIKRLHLDQKLIKADFNLTAMCFGCNRRISDFLSKKDVNFYLSRFGEPNHRNYKIVPYLKRIKGIQEEGS